jgi:hypothetical protein
MKKLATLLGLIAALAVAVPVAAHARHAADDPVGHVRHGGDDRAGDDSRARQSTATAKAAKAAGREDGRGRRRRRPATTAAASSDDGPNHS